MNLVSRLSGITGSKADIIHSAFYLPEFNRLSLVLCSLLRCKIIPGSFKKNPHVYHKILFAVIPIGYWIFYHNFVCISRNTVYCTCCQCCDARFFLYFQCVWHEQVAAILAIPCHSSVISYSQQEVPYVFPLHILKNSFLSEHPFNLPSSSPIACYWVHS